MSAPDVDGWREGQHLSNWIASGGESQVVQMRSGTYQFGTLTQEQLDYLVGVDWYVGDDNRWHNDKTGESTDRHWSDD